MSAAQPNYYEVLGLSHSATPEEVKKRYRELARRYHPDVNPNPDAAQKIKTINEAYHVLGDADRRAVYDADRFLRQVTTPRPQPAKPSATPANPPHPAPPKNQSRPVTPESAPDYNGFGRAFPNASTAPAARPQRAATPQDKSASQAQQATRHFGTAERLVAEAQLAFINHRYKEAEDLCGQALLIDRRNAVAHEILGDIYLKRAQHNAAATCYSYAIQFNPRNYSVQAKLERLLGKQSQPVTPPPQPTMTRPVPMAGWQKLMDGPNRDAGLATLSAILLVLFVSILFVLWEHPGIVPFSWSSAISPISSLSFNVLVAMAANGVIGGILLALRGGMRPISEELLTRGVTTKAKRLRISLGAVLAIFSLAWFYLSLLVYIGIGIAQDRISPSVMRVYGAVMALILLFAIIYRPGENFSGTGSGQVIAFGGNILFPTMLFGWAIGDAMRLRRR